MRDEIVQNMNKNRVIIQANVRLKKLILHYLI